MPTIRDDLSSSSAETVKALANLKISPAIPEIFELEWLNLYIYFDEACESGRSPRHANSSKGRIREAKVLLKPSPELSDKTRLNCDLVDLDDLAIGKKLSIMAPRNALGEGSVGPDFILANRTNAVRLKCDWPR